MGDKTPEKIIEEIIRLRVEERLSVFAISKRVGTCPATVTNWLRKRSVTLVDLKPACVACGEPVPPPVNGQRIPYKKYCSAACRSWMRDQATSIGRVKGYRLLRWMSKNAPASLAKIWHSMGEESLAEDLKNLRSP